MPTTDATYANPNPDLTAAASLSAPQGTSINGTSPITPTDLTSSEQPIKLPSAPQDPTANHLASISSIDTLFKNTYGTPSATETAQDATSKTLLDKFKEIMGLGGNVDSSGNVDTTGALAGAEDKAAIALGYKSFNDAQNQLQAINGQINALQKEALAIPLKLQEDAAGRGITEGGLSPIQTGLIRQNTIKALGLSSIAQTLQGNLALAQDQAKKAVDAEFLPLEQQLNYLRTAYDMNKDKLTREDSQKAALLQANLNERTRLLEAAKADKAAALSMSNAAVKNFPNNPAAQNAAQRVLSLDVNDPQYLSKVYQLVGQYQTDPNQTAKDIAQIQLARAQTAEAYANAAKIRTEAQTNGASPQVAEQRTQAVNLINGLLNDPHLESAVGPIGSPGFLQRYFSGTPTQNTINNIDQLKGILALDKRSLLKGSGAISDYESRTLDRAASSFGSNLSHTDAVKQLKQVRGVLTTMSGLPATVSVKDSSGNTQTVQATSAQISKMINDGLQVEYQ